ncbi:MAG: PH domain-containing protein [Planctomycetota bacterium]
MRPAGEAEPGVGVREVSAEAAGAGVSAGEIDHEAVAARAATLLPADLLDGGELVLLVVKPSPWYIVLAALRPLAWIAVVTAGLVTLNNAVVDLGWLGLGERRLPRVVDSRDLILLGFGVGGARLFWQLLEWLSRVYVLTDRRVIRVKGVLTVQVFQCTLAKLQQTDLVFTVRERLFGLGTIGFSTAGTGLSEAFWVMLARPLEVHKAVVEAMRKYGGRGQE